MGSSPRSTILSAQDCMSRYIAPVVGCQSRCITITITTDPMPSYGSITSLGRMPMTNGRPLSIGSSPCIACTISENPGGGHGGFWLDADCGSIISFGGVVGMSIFAVVVDQPSPWAANRDPLGQA